MPYPWTHGPEACSAPTAFDVTRPESLLFLKEPQLCSYELLKQHSMLQVLSRQCSTEQCKLPELLFTEGTCFSNRQRYYIVIALSQRKQNKIMEAVGRVHSPAQPFPTWTVVIQALSKALFIQPDCLRLKSTMELHQRDYLLLEQAFNGGSVNASSKATAPECIFEVDFGKQSDSMTWLCYWKLARPVVADLVQNCKTFLNSTSTTFLANLTIALKSLALLGEPKVPLPDEKARADEKLGACTKTMGMAFGKS